MKFCAKFAFFLKRGNKSRRYYKSFLNLLQSNCKSNVNLYLCGFFFLRLATSPLTLSYGDGKWMNATDGIAGP